MSAFILIHSPLVGPFTWALVAKEFEQRQIKVVVPSLTSNPGSDVPYWKQHAYAVARSTQTLPPDEAVVLVAHSGAGMLLPAIRQVMGRPIAGYIFVDAGIPQDGKGRLDRFEHEAAEQFRRSAIDGLLPTWTDADLAQVIPDDQTRARFVADLKPLPLAVYEEPIPVFDGWPDAPCSFIAFRSDDEYVYADSLRHVEQQRWLSAKMVGMHFHMLVDPVAVVDALLSVTREMGLVVA
ncbi:MAG: hypothetical protein ABIO92_00120 [Chloroflexia bacterium]